MVGEILDDKNPLKFPHHFLALVNPLKARQGFPQVAGLASHCRQGTARAASPFKALWVPSMGRKNSPQALPSRRMVKFRPPARGARSASRQWQWGPWP